MGALNVSALIIALHPWVTFRDRPDLKKYFFPKER